MTLQEKAEGMCELLKSDLYDMDISTAPVFTFTSPGGWRVEFGAHNKTTIWCHVFRPNGDMYATKLGADSQWLDEVLP